MNILHYLAQQHIKEKALTIGAIISALLIFSIPFSTTIAIILSILVFLCWLITAQFLNLFQLCKQYQPVFFALLLFIVFCVGLTYSNAPFNESISGLNKYRELLLFIILLPFFERKNYRQWAVNAFIIASIVTLLGSYAKFIGIIPSSELLGFSFKSRITHNLMMAFFAFYCSHQLLRLDKFSYVWGLLFLLTSYNIFFVVSGRTGQLVFVLLMMLWCIQRFNKKGIALSLLVLCLVIGGFIAFSQKADRIWEGVSETQTYFKTSPEKTETSMGLRLSFWENSLKLIAEKPLFGHGTGSYEYEYQRLVNSTDPQVTSGNPHNEYLMLTVQLGLFGLLLFLGFIISLHNALFKLADNEKWLLQGLLLTFMISNVFNSSLLDHTEGHWFLSLMALYFAPLVSIGKKDLSIV